FVRPGMGATNCSIGAYEFNAALAPCGTFLTTWGSAGSGDGQFNAPNSVAVDGGGNVFVSDLNNKRIEKFTNTGTFLTKRGSIGSGDGQFSNPVGVGVDGSGNVFVADNRNDRIQKFTCPTAIVTTWASTRSAAGTINTPTATTMYASDPALASNKLHHSV